MKKMLAIILSLSMIICCTAAINADEDAIVYKSLNQIAEKDINYVSAYNIVGNPKEYDGKKVRVVGLLEYDINNAALYVSTESQQLGITKNAIWCKITPTTLKTSYDGIKKLNGKFVMIEGVLNAENSGHTDKYSAAIEGITKIQEWK